VDSSHNTLQYLSKPSILFLYVFIFVSYEQQWHFVAKQNIIYWCFGRHIQAHVAIPLLRDKLGNVYTPLILGEFAGLLAALV